MYSVCTAQSTAVSRGAYLHMYSPQTHGPSAACYRPMYSYQQNGCREDSNTVSNRRKEYVTTRQGVGPTYPYDITMALRQPLTGSVLISKNTMNTQNITITQPTQYTCSA
jgi:hypothetical protein